MIKRMVKQQITESIDEKGWESYKEWRVMYDGNLNSILGRVGLSFVIYFYLMHLSSTRSKVDEFVDHCHNVARQLANPKVKFRIQTKQGGFQIIDDYFQGYKWIEKNTPEDSRVMAWWDY